jgi:hypothetical protein
MSVDGDLQRTPGSETDPLASGSIHWLIREFDRIREMYYPAARQTQPPVPAHEASQTPAAID